MAWSHLDVDKPHVAYIILGGFTSLFMLCSLFVKEKLYIGEATVATLCGIIFGPHAANLFNPLSWGNVDKITLECSRIVLVVQCFAVGVELPKAYMERHWKSVFLLLVPVMTWGWLATSLFIWWMVPPLSWLESLVCAACVTATDPVLASSVVGKGKFAKRVPKHLRDVLSAESGCNDGMAFPFIYLAFYIYRYRPDAGTVTLNWFCVTILYECIFGAVYGFLIGYLARHAIKFAERKQLIDRESFLVFYFVLALFCAGSGSLLGMDDLLIGFAAGVGFSNDGWFTEKTEESHVSNVIDLLLNLAYFVYFGSIIPWQNYNDPALGLVPWRLVVIALLVIFFRRIPIMLLMKPFIPDIKTWREALFAGHFGPIGVGAIFAAILARAELENNGTEPLPQSDLPTAPGQTNYYIIRLIWPITTFMVISSILVHGSSIAVFTLGKRINTLTISLSYTTANEDGPSWMNRLPRVQSIAKGSMSLRKPDADDLALDSSSHEKLPEYPPGTLPPIGVPRNFLRRVREEEAEPQSSRASSRRPLRRRRKKKSQQQQRPDIARIGGPISQSAIMPQPRQPSVSDLEKGGPEDEDTAKSESEERDRIDTGGSPASKERERFRREPQIEVYQEGHHLIIEDEEGNVLKTEDISHESPEEQRQHILEQRQRLQQDQSGEFAKSRSHPHEKTEGEEIKHAVEDRVGLTGDTIRKKLGKWAVWGQQQQQQQQQQQHPKQEKESTGGATTADTAGATTAKRSTRSAHAYQFGNTIIVEDEDGEVIKKYTIPATEKKADQTPAGTTDRYLRRGLTRMGTWLGMEEEGGSGGDGGESSQAAVQRALTEDDDGLRFTLADNATVAERGINHKGRRMNKREFIRQIQQLDPKARRDVVEQTDAPAEVKQVAQEEAANQVRRERISSRRFLNDDAQDEEEEEDSHYESVADLSDDEESSSDEHIPGHNVAASFARFSEGSAAQARRSQLGSASQAAMATKHSSSSSPSSSSSSTAAAAAAAAPPSHLQHDSDDDGTERIPPSQLRAGESGGPSSPPPPPPPPPPPMSAIPRIRVDLHDDDDDDDDTGETPAERRRRLAALGQLENPGDDSEEDGENDGFRAVRGKVQFADGPRPSESRTTAGTVHRSETDGQQSYRRHRPRISWGGESGRDD